MTETIFAVRMRNTDAVFRKQAAEQLAAEVEQYQNQKRLAVRGLWSVTEQFSTVDVARQTLEWAYDDDWRDEFGRLLLVGESDNVVGTAQYDALMPLRSQRLPVAAALTRDIHYKDRVFRNPMGVDLEMTEGIPYVSAWASIETRARTALYAAYTSIRKTALDDGYKAGMWTVEPVDSPVFADIQRVDFKPESAPARYDTFEPGEHAPHVAQLFIAPTS